MKNIFTFLALVGIIAFVSCSKDSPTNSAQVSEITLSVTSDLSLEIGQTSQEITLTGGNDHHYQLTIEDASVVEVIQKGNTFVVKGLKVGQTIIVVRSAQKTKTLKVVVSAPAISLNNVVSPLQLKVGETQSVELSGGNGKEYQVQVSSSDVVEVSTSNNVLTIKALKQGKAHFTITSEGQTAELDVEVSNVLIERIEIQEENNFQAGTYTLTAKIYPESASIKELTWETSNSDVVRVDSKTGHILVKPRYGASAIITARANDGSGVMVQHVINVVQLVREIIINQGDFELGIGVQTRLTAHIEPADATNKTLTWESSDSSVVQVDNQGNIETLKEGRATITARATDGSYTYASSEIKVILGINKITIEQANGTTSMEVTRGVKTPLSISIWHNDQLKGQGIQNQTTSGFGSVSWRIVSQPDNNTAFFGRRDRNEGYIFDPNKTGVVTIKATYYDSLSGDSIDSETITITIKD